MADPNADPPLQSPAATDMLAMYLADKDPTTSLPMKYIWTSLSESAGAPGSGSYRWGGSLWHRDRGVRVVFGT